MGKLSRESASFASPSSSSANLTTSTAITDTLNGSHKFTIGGYSLAKGKGVGRYMASDTFNVGGYSWAIYFYPDGKSMEDNAAYVSLFIALDSEGTDVRALFELTLLDQSGKERHKVHTHFGRALESGPYTLKYRGSMWGYKRFFKRNLLETSDYLKDDCLQVHCNVGVVRSHTECPKTYSVTVPPSDIGRHFGKLWESGEGTDVNFEVDGDVFPAHKLVLAARSPVFRAQLFGPMKDQNAQLIEVKDMEAPVFKALLHFIYWDSLPDLEELVGLNSKRASTLMSQHLLAAADRYGLERLRILCEATLCEDVAINTVATTLALAELHHCLQLKAVCLKFVAMPENLKAVMQTEGFEYLKGCYASVLTELLDYVARVSEHSTIVGGDGNGVIIDGSDVNGRGYKRFFKRNLLETSDYLKDDCLQVHCNVGVVRSHTEGPKTYSITVPPSDISHHFGKLWESGEGTDVNFEVDGDVFPAHKLVLAARSPVFQAQLFGPMKDQNAQLIEVKDMEAPVFKALLHFIYWDSLPDLEELAGLNSKRASTLMSQHLLAAADRYGLERLRILCEANLCEDVAINTVATTLALAEHHHCLQLKAVCLKFVAMPENLKAVMQTEGFEYLRGCYAYVLTELLDYVARVSEHSTIVGRDGNGVIIDGSDVNGRRVKQRL